MGYTGIRLGCGTPLHLTILLIGTLALKKGTPKSRRMVLGWQDGPPRAVLAGGCCAVLRQQVLAAL